MAQARDEAKAAVIEAQGVAEEFGIAFEYEATYVPSPGRPPQFRRNWPALPADAHEASFMASLARSVADGGEVDGTVARDLASRRRKKGEPA